MAKQVKTIRGLIGLLKKIATQDVDEIKGYDKMSQHEKDILSFLLGEVNNFIGELGEVAKKV